MSSDSADSIDASADSTTAPAPSTDSTSTASSWASSLPPDSIILVPNQLSKRILSPGDPSSSRIPNGAQVTVHYTGKLLDGTIFDSSHKRNDPFQFKIGLSQVIKGWDEGVATMKKGEKALLRCEPEYAYGKRGSPPTIPPNATLEFEVDLLDYNDRENVTEDGGITKKVIVTGTSGTLVTEYSKVIVSFIGKIKGEKGAVDQVFVEKKNQSWVIGDDDGLPQGLEESILSMTQTEKSEFLVTRKHGFGAEGSKEFSIPIPPNATLIYEVEVESVEKPKPLFQLQFKEVLDLMIRIKDIGNKAYKKSLDPKVLPATREKLFERSLKKWNSALQLFESEDEIKSEEDKKLVIPVKLSLLTNIAIVKLKQKSFNDVLENANKALELDPKNVKAIFKKGQALAGLGQDDEAIRAFKQAQELDSDNKEIVKEINAIKKKNAEIIAKERKAFGGFFNKVSLVSKEEEEASRKAAEAEKAKMAVDSDSDEEDEPASSSTADGAGSTSSDAEKVNDERADTEKKLDNDVPIEKSEKPASAE